MSAAHEAQSPGGAGQCAEEITADAQIVEPAFPSDKEFATVQALYALKGHALVRVIDSYAAHKWGLVRYMPKWSDVLDFLDQIGGQHD